MLDRVCSLCEKDDTGQMDHVVVWNIVERRRMANMISLHFLTFAPLAAVTLNYYQGTAATIYCYYLT